jgi:hypothetical protein
LQSNERLLWGGQISYQQAHQLREAIIEEIDGSEIDSFALLLDLVARMLAADDTNRVLMLCEESGEFLAIAVALGPLRAAAESLQPYTGLDAAHTKLRFQMMLLLATRIDANGQILPLA